MTFARSCFRSLTRIDCALRGAAWAATMLIASGSAANASSTLAPSPHLLSADGDWNSLPGYSRSGGLSQASIYDPTGDRIVTLDGSDFSVFTERVDQFTLAGVPTWSPLLARGPRPPLRDEAMAMYDPRRHRMIVVLATSNDNSAVMAVWALDLGSAPAWALLSTGTTAPPGRSGFTAIYDALRDRVIVFGGLRNFTASQYLNDVWEFELTTNAWSQIHTAGASPPPRGSHVAVFDAVDDQMTIFGGISESPSLQLFAEVWTLSLGAVPTWHLLDPAGPPPPGNVRAAAVYDDAANRMIVQGGFVLPDGDQNTTWALSLGNQPAWTQLAPDGEIPPAAGALGAVVDSYRHRMILGSGYVEFGNIAYALSLTGNPHWSRIYGRGEGPYPEGYALTPEYDAARRSVFVVTYSTSNGATNPSGWRLSLQEPVSWQRLPSVGLPAGLGVAGNLLDPKRRRIIAFTSAGDAMTVALGDTFTWSALPGVGWGPLGSRFGASRAYDPVHDRWLVFGGWSGGYSSPVAEVWSFSLPTLSWNQVPTSGGGPVGRFEACAAYDPVRDRLIVFGGSHDTNQSTQMTGLNDVWALSLAGTPSWEQLAQTSASTPAGRYGAAAFYDSRRDRIVISGGVNYATAFSDVWALSLAPSGGWSLLAATGTAPTFPAITDYDSTGDRGVGTSLYLAPYHVDVLQFGDPRPPSVACPPNSVPAFPGVHDVDYTVTNNDATTHRFDFVLNAARAWPEFPLNGFAVVPGGTSQLITIGLPLPDTATARGAVTFTIWPHGSPSLADSCRHVLGDVQTDALADLVSISIETGVVHVTWFSSRSGSEHATVYRSENDNGWVAIGEPTTNGTGLMQFADTGVQPGRRYGYRLGVGPPGGEQFTREAWIDVPGTTLALRGAWPNPGRGHLSVALTLPNAGPARLELFDLAGRRLESHAVGALGPGMHIAELGRTTALRPGLYLIRLEQAGRTLTARACLIQ